MPRKTKFTKTEETGPTQGEIARLITDSYEVLVSQLMSDIVAENEGTLNLSRDNLLALNEKVTKHANDTKNRTISNLLKHYK